MSGRTSSHSSTRSTVSRNRLLIIGLGIVLGGVLLSSCAGIDYYRQSIGGHLSIIAKRTDVATLLEDEQTDESLKQDLRSVLEVREFASTELALPDNDSYRSYVDVARPYVLWNVVAAGEFSLVPNSWCYPITGCVAYRGYYSQTEAYAFAEVLRTQGLDVFVGGVRAYSTLGWFDDPVLNTMLDQPFSYLAGVIFHELAHQRIYIKGDTTFNESFAVAVEREGVRRWFHQHDDAAGFKLYRERLAREQRFVELVLETRKRLQHLYDQEMDGELKRSEKRRLFDALRSQYRDNADWFGGGFAQWLETDLNNAKLALMATYHEQIPAFERLLELHDGDMTAFYLAVEELGALPSEERSARIRSLARGEN